MKLTSVGDGPDLVLIHGWGIGASAWDELLPLLTPNFRVHRIALPGYASAAPDGADFIDTAAALAESLPVGSTLCGWSLGGLLALQAALLAPLRVGRLVLCGATPSFVQRDGWPHAQPPALLDRFDEALAKDAAQTLQRFIALFNQGDRQARAITRTLAKALADGLADHTTLARGLDWLRRVDLRAQVSAIAQPTLVIHGEADPLMPLAAAHWLAAALPDAQLEVFGGAAHAPFVNDRERFAQLLTDFCHAPAPR